MFAFLKYFAVIFEGPLQTPFTGLTGPMGVKKSMVKSIYGSFLHLIFAKYAFYRYISSSITT